MYKRYMPSIFLASISLGLTATPLHAEEKENIVYQVKAGDTLYGLAEKFFVSSQKAHQVQRINRIRNPRKIPIGKTLSIPRTALKYDLVALRIQSYSGSVSLIINGKRRQAKVGDIVSRGTEIATGSNGFVALSGADGTRITMPTNSRARVETTRRYRINGALDVDFRILKGRGSIKAPKIQQNGRFKVGTPIAVTAVRGTEFRVAHDPATGLATTEVVEGAVQVSAQETEALATAGYGVPATPEGLLPVEKLLAAPKLSGAGQTHIGPVVSFTIERIGNAKAYRTQIARDENFKDIVAESYGESLETKFTDLDLGRLYVRSRAVSQSGIEGLTETQSFRHKSFGANSTAHPMQLDGGLRIKWRNFGEGTAYQAFQLWRAGERDALIVDEVGLLNDGVEINMLEAGDYEWRVGTFQIDEGETLKVWEPAQRITISN